MFEKPIVEASSEIKIGDTRPKGVSIAFNASLGDN